jgi:hypothetical protein
MYISFNHLWNATSPPGRKVLSRNFGHDSFHFFNRFYRYKFDYVLLLFSYHNSILAIYYIFTNFTLFLFAFIKTLKLGNHMNLMIHWLDLESKYNYFILLIKNGHGDPRTTLLESFWTLSRKLKTHACCVYETEDKAEFRVGNSWVPRRKRLREVKLQDIHNYLGKEWNPYWIQCQGIEWQ